MPEFISGLAVSSLDSVPFAYNCKQGFLIIIFFGVGEVGLSLSIFQAETSSSLANKPIPECPGREADFCCFCVLCFFVLFFLKKSLLMLEILCRGKWLMCLQNLLPVLH